MSRIGVFICHCGTNIAGALDVEEVAREAGKRAGVRFATTYKYMCSEQGQQTIKDAITEHELDRIVIASCSPRMHETTFRKMLKGTSINPYMLEIANIREQCAWVHTDREAATKKAVDLVRMAVAKVGKNKPLFTSSIPVHKKALVVGAGIAGIQAALDIADAGYEVTLVERESSIGGHMVMLEELRFSPENTKVIMCGPSIMIRLTVERLAKLGFKREDVITSMETRMKCGIGKCGRCNIGSKYVCLDGPVFLLTELDELPNE